MSEDLTARLSRWSQRKLAARRGAAVDEIRPGDEAQPPAAEAPAAEPNVADAAPEEMPTGIPSCWLTCFATGPASASFTRITSS